jgi:hypothetical protein
LHRNIPENGVAAFAMGTLHNQAVKKGPPAD